MKRILVVGPNWCTALPMVRVVWTVYLKPNSEWHMNASAPCKVTDVTAHVLNLAEECERPYNSYCSVL